jgi:RecA/RadA recombinase
MSQLLERLRKTSTIKEASSLSDSKFFTKKDMITTSVPALNVALSGELAGGFTPGLTLFCGPSKHFKSLFSLLLAKAYMDKYKDAVLIFYDCEFGTPESYFDSLEMDKSRILHIPIMNMEEFKFDVMKQLEDLKRGDRVVFVVDSLGNMSSKKEMEDAIAEKSVADMSRAKQMKSIFRMITPYLNRLDIPMIAVNHIYMEQGLYPKAIVSGGTGIYLSSDTIFIIGRQQEKDGTEVVGYNFVINVEKSRYTREKSKILINVTHERGINRYSGLLEMAMEAGAVIKPSNGWYSRVNLETGEVEDKKFREAATSTKEFWDILLNDTLLQDKIRDRFKVSAGTLLTDETIDAEMDLA